MTVQDTYRYTVDLKPNYIFISWIQGGGGMFKGRSEEGGALQTFGRCSSMKGTVRRDDCKVGGKFGGMIARLEEI